MQCDLQSVGHRKRWNETGFHNIKYHSLAVGHRKRWNETDVHKITYNLLVIGTDSYDESAFHTMCKVTHLLLVIGKDVMRLPFIQYEISLNKLLVIGNDVTV